MEIKELMKEIKEFLIFEEINDEKISFILKKEDDYKLILNRENNPDEMYAVVIQDYKCGLYPIYDWDFSIDSHFFEELKDGFEICYMPIEEHAAAWQLINEMRNDIHCKEGLQLYLKYCQQNEITPKLISKICGETIDITDLYNETNIGYKIIASVDIASNTVVLGQKNNKPSQYVTWFTTPTRKNGYDIGHYFNSFEVAYKDFKQRATDLFAINLETQKYKVRSIKEKQYER